MPEPAGANVQSMAARLADEVETSAAAVLTRHREGGPSQAAAE